MKPETKATLLGAGAGVLGVALFVAQTTQAQDPTTAPDDTYISMECGSFWAIDQRSE